MFTTIITGVTIVSALFLGAPATTDASTLTAPVVYVTGSGGVLA